MKDKAYAAWQDNTHAEEFDKKWASLTTQEMKQRFASYDEIKLFSNYFNDSAKEVLEIGCASGEMYRFLRETYPDIQYYGYDISTPAIALAKAKFSEGFFQLTSPDLTEVFRARHNVGLLYSKDVVLHQTEPYRFLDKLLSLGANELLLKFRTRDVGATETDVSKSRQQWCGEWIPYIVLNYIEFLRFLTDSKMVEFVHTIRHYKPLHGLNGRELPEDLASESAGTASTSVYIKLGENSNKIKFLESAHGKHLTPGAAKILLMKSKLKRRFSMLFA